MQSTRKKDTCIRFGGDEFIIMIQEDDNIEDILNRLVQNCNFNFKGINISAAIGVAHYPTDTKDPKELLILADKAMYKSKRKGLPFF